MYTLHCFGIARDIIAKSSLEIDSKSIRTVGDLRGFLDSTYIQLGEISSYMLAVNQAYADDNLLIAETDEIAIIPPVSGG